MKKFKVNIGCSPVTKIVHKKTIPCTKIEYIKTGKELHKIYGITSKVNNNFHEVYDLLLKRTICINEMFIITKEPVILAPIVVYHQNTNLRPGSFDKVIAHHPDFKIQFVKEGGSQNFPKGSMCEIVSQNMHDKE